MADAPDDRELAPKSVRPVGPLPMPPRPGETMRRLGDLTDQPKPHRDGSCLSVGRGITLSGEVNSCDKLFIEGSVDAKLTNCRAIEIAENGLFKGSTTIDEAEIRGRFEGDLVVRNRLLIRATGRVSGTIRYGQIEIECGGQILATSRRTRLVNWETPPQAPIQGFRRRIVPRCRTDWQHPYYRIIDRVFINEDYAGARRERPRRLGRARAGRRGQIPDLDGRQCLAPGDTFVLPALDAPFLAGRALGLDGAVATAVVPVAVQRQSVLDGGEPPGQ